MTPEPSADAEAAPEPVLHRTDPLTERGIDPWLFGAVVVLVGLGLVMVYSAGSWIARDFHGTAEYFLMRQAAFVVVGMLLMLACAGLDYRILRRFSGQAMFVTMAALVAVLIFGTEVNGARRWIRFGGFGFQPSELAKIALTVFLAATLARQGERVRRFAVGFVPPMIVASLTMGLVLLERDLGTVVLLGTLTLTMLFVAGTRVTYVAAAIMAAAPILWYQVVAVDYRRERLQEFVAGDGYQVHQALIAVGSGGTWGRGLGAGRQKLGFLPENHTDFIVATIGEELGIVGIVLVVAAVAVVVWRGFLAARRAPDRFGTYLAVGLSAMFGLQTLVNMAVVLDMVPAKGITLPFVSYGGTSLLVSLIGAGLLLSVARRPEPWALGDQRGRRGWAPARRAEGGVRNRRRDSEPAAAV